MNVFYNSGLGQDYVKPGDVFMAPSSMDNSPAMGTPVELTESEEEDNRAVPHGGKSRSTNSSRPHVPANRLYRDSSDLHSTPVYGGSMASNSPVPQTLYSPSSIPHPSSHLHPPSIPIDPALLGESQSTPPFDRHESAELAGGDTDAEGEPYDETAELEAAGEDIVDPDAAEIEDDSSEYGKKRPKKGKAKAGPPKKRGRPPKVRTKEDVKSLGKVKKSGKSGVSGKGGWKRREKACTACNDRHGRCLGTPCTQCVKKNIHCSLLNEPQSAEAEQVSPAAGTLTTTADLDRNESSEAGPSSQPALAGPSSRKRVRHAR